MKNEKEIETIILEVLIEYPFNKEILLIDLVNKIYDNPKYEFLLKKVPIEFYSYFIKLKNKGKIDIIPSKSKSEYVLSLESKVLKKGDEVLYLHSNTIKLI